jgi:acyl-coenzyme A thioesterase PaaI-like protein
LSAGQELPPHKDCFVCGIPGDERIDIRYYWEEAAREVTARVVFGRLSQGPPKHVHGGAIAAVLDEAMGTCAWLNGHMCVAVNIDIDYRKMIPLERTLEVRCAVRRVEGRKIFAHGTMTAEDGEILAESEGIFVTVGADRMGGLVPGLLEDISAFERYQRMRAAAGHSPP